MTESVAPIPIRKPIHRGRLLTVEGPPAALMSNSITSLTCTIQAPSQGTHPGGCGVDRRIPLRCGGSPPCSSAGLRPALPRPSRPLPRLGDSCCNLRGSTFPAWHGCPKPTRKTTGGEFLHVQTDKLASPSSFVATAHAGKFPSPSPFSPPTLRCRTRKPWIGRRAAGIRGRPRDH